MKVYNTPLFILPFLVLIMGTSIAQSGKFTVKELIRVEDYIINNHSYKTYNGFIEVPEDWGVPSSRKLQLPLLVIKSSSNEPAEPILWLAGGPGAQNIHATKNGHFLKNHDFVCVGYRGTTGNSILSSHEMGEALKGVNDQLLSDASLDNFEAKMRDYLALLKNEGVDITKYTMMEVIEDLEYARKALGYEKISLYSESYGTRLALIYSYKYPEVIKRSVMEVVNPPGHFLWEAKQTDRILDKYDSIFKAQLPMNSNGSIKKAMITAFKNMPKRWSFFKLDPDKIKTMTFLLLFQKEMAVNAFHAYFNAANHKDYSGLYFMQLAYDFMVESEAIGDLCQKGISADFDPTINYREELRKDTTILGYNYSLLLFGSGAAWHTNSIPEEYRKVRTSQTETLMISGNLDVSTPAENATIELLPYLPNGHQVILSNMSHNDVAVLQIDTYRQFIAHYIDTGEVRDTLFKHDEVDFTPKMKFGLLAKWWYPVVLGANFFN